jgi:hypothetical protein
VSATSEDFEAGYHERHARANRKPSEVKDAILEELTFDKLRDVIPIDEVDHFSLSVVIHRARKIVRQG